MKKTNSQKTNKSDEVMKRLQKKYQLFHWDLSILLKLIILLSTIYCTTVSHTCITVQHAPALLTMLRKYATLFRIEDVQCDFLGTNLESFFQFNYTNYVGF